jgi:hypothetical protein
MYRPGDDGLWAGFPGHGPVVAPGAAKWLLLLCLGWLALLLSTFHPERGDRRTGFAPGATKAAKARVAAPPPVPEIVTAEPMALTADEARAFNATVGFVSGPISPAKRFVFAGSRDDRERALTCLASAAWYEAGDDKTGERAVVQVVLNRARHPAFPSSICGVVFEGASRRTGCQFTFTCDGSLRREPSPEAWKRARDIADHALAGYVFKKVGNATHYHTDWVVPYWSDTLDKLAQVDSHIFYRWRGDWGKAAAFTQRPGGVEQLDPRIADLADPRLASVKPADEAAATSPAPGVVMTKTADGRQHLIATVAPPSPRPQPTVLPLPPASVREILPSVAPPSQPPVIDPAVIRYWWVPPPRKSMSFNEPAASAGHGTAADATRKPHLMAK